MKKALFTLLLAVSAAAGCQAQPGRTTVFEPVRFEDGTPVTEEAAEALFAGDTFLTDTTFSEKGDTLLVIRHTSAYVRMQVDGIPEGVEKVLLVPMEGTPTELSVTEPGPMVLWTARAPGVLGAAAVVAEAPDGRLWSARLPGKGLEAGIACRWTAILIPPTAPPAGISASPLPQALLTGIPSGEYSGITRIGGDTYAVVSDNLGSGGIVHFTIPVKANGEVGEVSVRIPAGTTEGRKSDCEGVAYLPSTGTLFVSSEADQSIREYDLEGVATGKSLAVPADLASDRILANRGFEALTFGGGLLWTMTESPVKGDTFLRLQSFRVDGTPAARYLYLTDTPSRSADGAEAYVHGVPALTALDDGRLLVLEREVYVPKGGFWTKLLDSFTKMKLYLVDPAGDPAGILRKSLLCSFRTGATGLANFEGMCLGPELPGGSRSLLLIADSQNNTRGLTQEYLKVILLR